MGDAREVEQFNNLPENWETDREVFEAMAKEHVFSCQGGVDRTKPCNTTATATTMRTVKQQNGGKSKDYPVLYFLEIGVVEIGKGYRAIYRGIHDHRHAEEQITAAKKAEAKFPAGVKLASEIAPSPLFTYLKRRSSAKIRQLHAEKVGRFFFSLVKGEVKVAEGIELGYLLPVNEEELDTSLNYLSVGSEVVASVNKENTDLYHQTRLANTEVFRKGNVYLQPGKLSEVKQAVEKRAAEQAVWAAKREEETRARAEEAKRREANQAVAVERRAAAEAEAADWFIQAVGGGTGVSTRTAPVHAPSAPKQKKGKGGARQPSRPREQIAPERKAVSEGLALTEELAKSEPSAESSTESTRTAELPPSVTVGGSSPLKASLIEIAKKNSE